jgi:hypothetical protein
MKDTRKCPAVTLSWEDAEVLWGYLYTDPRLNVRNGWHLTLHADAERRALAESAFRRLQAAIGEDAGIMCKVSLNDG